MYSTLLLPEYFLGNDIKSYIFQFLSVVSSEIGHKESILSIMFVIKP